MAFVHGSDGKLTISGTTITSFVDNVDWQYSMDSHDVTVYGKNAHDKLGGLYDGSATVSGVFDNSSGAAGLEILFRPGSTSVTLVYWDGNLRRTVEVLRQSFSVTAPVADMIRWSASLEFASTVAVSTATL
jgi:hypothetical protein